MQFLILAASGGAGAALYIAVRLLAGS